MDKFSFYEGYMVKTANLMIPGAVATAVPAMIGAPSGALASILTSPSPGSVKEIQAEYVKMKFEQALKELEEMKRVQKMKGAIKSGRPSLRI